MAARYSVLPISTTYCLKIDENNSVLEAMNVKRSAVIQHEICCRAPRKLLLQIEFKEQIRREQRLYFISMEMMVA